MLLIILLIAGIGLSHGLSNIIGMLIFNFDECKINSSYLRIKRNNPTN